MTITTAARRIARKHNTKGMQGNGFLLFGEDGSGGAWYSNGSRPDMEGCIRVNMQWTRMTAAEAQEIIDRHEERRAEEAEEARWAQSDEGRRDHAEQRAQHEAMLERQEAEAREEDRRVRAQMARDDAADRRAAMSID